MSLPANTVLYDRYARLVIGPIGIDGGGPIAKPTGLRFDFKVTKTLKTAANKAEINVYGLNREHRKQIDQMKTPAVSLDAGYQGGSSQIFLGFLRTGLTTRQGPDVVTHLGSGDGEEKIRKSRVAISIAKGTPNYPILVSIAKAVGVEDGNLGEALKSLAAIAPKWPAGTVLYGSASREMTHICKALDLEWSVQAGKLQILPRGKPLPGAALKLNDISGLLDAPTLDNKGIMGCKMLMAPDVYPGRIVVIDAEFLSGQFRIEETTHTGDTHADPWVIEIKGKKY
jgi:hypothetical protein